MADAKPQHNGMTAFFNTPIPANKQKQYEQWKQKVGPNDPNFNYDYQGAFIGGATRSGDNNHFPDTYKKPNHPTFSTESKYSGSSGFTGGNWQKNVDGSWTFYASPDNLKFHTADELKRYFAAQEAGNQLVLPK